MPLSAIFRDGENYFPFVFEEKRFCRWKFQEAKINFRSFLKKNASVGENRAEGRAAAGQISPTELENRKNERKLKCED